MLGLDGQWTQTNFIWKNLFQSVAARYFIKNGFEVSAHLDQFDSSGHANAQTELRAIVQFIPGFDFAGKIGYPYKGQATQKAFSGVSDAAAGNLAENNFSHLYLSVGTKIHLPGDHTSVKIVGEVTENKGEKFSERLKIRAGVSSVLTKTCKICCGVEIKRTGPAHPSLPHRAGDQSGPYTAMRREDPPPTAPIEPTPERA